MDSAIWVSIISGVLTLTGVILTNMNSNRKIEQQLEVSMAVTNTKLEDLTKQVEKHNQVIERTYKLEKASALHEEQLKNIGRRVDNLEDK